MKISNPPSRRSYLQLTRKEYEELGSPEYVSAFINYDVDNISETTLIIQAFLDIDRSRVTLSTRSNCRQFDISGDVAPRGFIEAAQTMTLMTICKVTSVFPPTKIRATDRLPMSYRVSITKFMNPAWGLFNVSDCLVSRENDLSGNVVMRITVPIIHKLVETPPVAAQTTKRDKFDEPIPTACFEPNFDSTTGWRRDEHGGYLRETRIGGTGGGETKATQLFTLRECILTINRINTTLGGEIELDVTGGKLTAILRVA